MLNGVQSNKAFAFIRQSHRKSKHVNASGITHQDTPVVTVYTNAAGVCHSVPNVVIGAAFGVNAWTLAS